MASIDWQTPPYQGRLYRKHIINDGEVRLKHTDQPAQQEGWAKVRGQGATFPIVSAAYVSYYQFQIKPDSPSENGPWDIEFFLIISAAVNSSLEKKSFAEARVTTRAWADRLSDFQRIYQKDITDSVKLDGSKSYNNILFQSDSTELRLKEDEYNLTLITEINLWLSPDTYGTQMNHVELDLEQPHGTELNLYIL